MDSAMIGKIMKANQYAQEPERVRIRSLQVDFHGNHDMRQVSYQDESWHCTCDFFAQRGRCSHTMALEKLLGAIVPPLPAEVPVAVAPVG
jgi:hypothetical protein